MTDLTTASTTASVLQPPLPKTARELLRWGQPSGSAHALALAQAAQLHPGPVVIVAPDSHSALHLEAELGFFLADSDLEVRLFPDWETLPYDLFSPLPDIVAQRLSTLYRLPERQSGVVIVPVATLLQRLPPKDYLDQHALLLAVGDKLEPNGFRLRLEAAGYSYVSQVIAHGEFTVRGSIIDLFPASSELPYRIDLFDDEVETIRSFDPETQRSTEQSERIELLPAREFPLTKDAISHFRQRCRELFGGDLSRNRIYQDVSDGRVPGGIEYYLPLFFEHTATLFDYLPAQTLMVTLTGVEQAMLQFQEQVAERHEQRTHDIERPILPPELLFLTTDQARQRLQEYPAIICTDEEPEMFACKAPPMLALNLRADKPAAAVQAFLDTLTESQRGRALFVTESAGRRELLLEMLAAYGLRPKICQGWADFLRASDELMLCVAPLAQGLYLQDPTLAIIAESQLHEEWTPQTRRRTTRRDADAIIRNLSDLAPGAAVVHEQHGVGRYAGLQRMDIAGLEAEFVVLEYAGSGKLYVPVAGLHMLSRYTGASPEVAPLHKLGSDQWEKARRKAAEKVRDVAAELLDIYARREARPGYAFQLSDADYMAFAAAFPFEETPDQAATIHAVVNDMRSDRPMDRVVCGDVGFGKTEVAMRAAFVAVQDGRQVAVLVPTTLLAQQHYQNFLDRFADWPVRIELLSRFRTKKQADATLAAVTEGTVDILIGTHKIIQDSVQFKRLGLVIIDEEHRFGVRQKERLKALRAEVDVLTLTATPIPRTLNMTLSSLRDLSLIVTPPVGRLAVQTFVSEWNDGLIREAIQRELKRGGQVYFLHNEVQSIERMAAQLRQIAPEVRLAVAHGQMRERELEHVMLDFYHQRCNLLLCTTIIESGIDVPSANTIIINRADKLGLAQLHQLRGRVGRSHHRAYAYLLTPPRKSLSADASKRIDAIESLEDLGAGFMLANHDLEIRGAGELLGEDQSGQIHEIGFTLYMEMLERAVKALKAGRQPELDRPLDHGPEIDLQMPALIPEDYLPDVHNRLILYKRIASAESADELKELQIEMIDRFGLLPQPVKNLFDITRLKLRALPIGIRKIEAGPKGGRIVFNAEPTLNIEALITLIQTQPKVYKLDGQEKLRFSKSLPEPETRIQEVSDLLERVAV